MSTTTTVRLDAAEEALLDRVAKRFGGRSQALKAGLAMVARESERLDRLDQLVADWEAESGPVDDAAVDALAERYGV